jgi:hypothetical protein
MSRTSITSRNKGLGLFLIFFALVIVVVGMFIIRTDLVGRGEAFPVWGWAVMVMTAGPLLIIGAVLVGRGLRIDRTSKAGLAGEATVLSAKQAAFGVGSGNDMDQRVTPILKLVLQVTVPGHLPYEAKVNELAPGVRRFQMQPGATLPVRVDPKKLSRVIIDWDRGTASTIGHLGALGLALPGVQLPGAVPVGTMPVAATAALTMPALPVVPYTGTESPDTLRATVRQVGLPGTATIDTVVPAGTGADGRLTFVLGMWVNIGGPTPTRVDNAPAAVEPHLAHKVAVGATVPVRVAQIGAAQATVLLWDEA